MSLYLTEMLLINGFWNWRQKMISMMETALAVVRELKLPVFPCVETLSKKGGVPKRPYTKTVQSSG
ncbi:hypothetical protein N8932_03480 [Alphaproteobacteria bacterium]|nr:hypothetical protein [Alphaproteobacteria bacterium]